MAPSAAADTDAGFKSAASQFAAVRQIVARRCVPCHAAQPSQPGFSAAPNGVLLDTPADLLARAAVLAPQVETRAMPIGNLTGMTESERTQLLDWIRRGTPH
jgi:uncharacterized membrane protein